MADESPLLRLIYDHWKAREETIMKEKMIPKEEDVMDKDNGGLKDPMQNSRDHQLNRMQSNLYKVQMDTYAHREQLKRIQGHMCKMHQEVRLLTAYIRNGGKDAEITTMTEKEIKEFMMSRGRKGGK